MAGAAPVTVIEADPGPAPDIAMLPTARPAPWAGGGGHYAIPEVLEAVRTRAPPSSSSTPAQAELFFQALWAANDDNLPIGLHHGSLARESRARVEAAMAAGELRAVVATGSLDLGIDWGAVDLVIQVGALQERQAAGPAHRPRQSPLQRALEGADRAREPL